MKASFGNLSLSWSTYFIVMNLLLILNQQKPPEHKALMTFVFPTVSYQSACTTIFIGMNSESELKLIYHSHLSGDQFLL